jgi:hypothetical protein
MAKERVIINPKVPPELRELVESTTAALKAHTAEGKAILLTELRKKYDALIKECRDAGIDKITVDEKTKQDMVLVYAEAHGEKYVIPAPDVELPEYEKRALKVFGAIYNKAVWEGLMTAYATFTQFKDEVLIENES